MEDSSKTKQALTEELASLKRRIRELEQSETERKKAEIQKETALSELRKSEEKYQMLVEAVSDVIYEIDHQGVVLYINPIGGVSGGYDQSDVVGRNFIEFVHPDDRELLIKRFHELSAGVEYPLTYRLMTKSGEYGWVQTRTKPRMENGKFIGAIGILTNITDQKRAEEALRESEIKYRQMFESIEDIYYITDIAGTIENVSPSVFNLAGWTPDELIGKSAMDIYADHSDREKLMSALLKHSYVRDFEMMLKDKQGTLRPASVSARLIFDADGTPRGLAGTVRDITERKQAEGKLRESEERYRILFEGINDAVFVHDLGEDGLPQRFLQVNDVACRRLGYTKEELLSLTPRDITMPEEYERIAGKRTGLVSQGEILIETIHVTKDGRKIPVESNIHQFQYLGRQVALSISRDITDRKQAEEKLKHTLESLRNAFSATVKVMVSAVEIRDPYTAGHQRRSADLARAIATEMGLSQDRIDGIRMAGNIHDIGKLSVPAEILAKPTKLEEIEFSLIKAHAKKGYEMLKDVESPWPLAEIVYQHHERMDGSGYPRHLKGEEILMAARILALADVVESMASHRPYRPALGINAALEEIENNKGTLYDADAVDVCLRLFREKGFQFKETR